MSTHLNQNSAAVAEIDLAGLDLRYEGHRLKQPRLEEQLLSSIAERGILEPLEGVQCGGSTVLLNGFKRYRCARKLHLATAPFVCWGPDAIEGILRLLRADRRHALHLLEQACFVDELRQERALSVAEIAAQLGRSKAWVTLRAGLRAELTLVVREALFAGAFPVYSFLYTLRPFRRLHPAGLIDQFVQAVRGHDLSVREIEGLAHGFFRGPESFRQEVLKGHLHVPLEQFKTAAAESDGCSDAERVFLQELERVHHGMFRIIRQSQDAQLRSPAFLAQCNLLTASVVARSGAFLKIIRSLHDRTGQA